MRQLAMLCVLAVGCGGHDLGDVDDTIGNSCSDDRDCDDVCLGPSGDFPGGFCSLRCIDDGDCPGDTYCVTSEGGTCLFICPDFRCSDLGPGWQCEERDHVGGGKVFVCHGD